MADRCLWKECTDGEDCARERDNGYPFCRQHAEKCFEFARRFGPNMGGGTPNPYVENWYHFFLKSIAAGAGVTIGTGMVVALYKAATFFLEHTWWLYYGGGPGPMVDNHISFDRDVLALMVRFPEHAELIRKSVEDALGYPYDPAFRTNEDYKRLEYPGTERPRVERLVPYEAT